MESLRNHGLKKANRVLEDVQTDVSGGGYQYEAFCSIHPSLVHALKAILSIYSLAQRTGTCSTL
jgi:hypothetical protein